MEALRELRGSWLVLAESNPGLLCRAQVGGEPGASPCPVSRWQGASSKGFGCHLLPTSISTKPLWLFGELSEGVEASGLPLAAVVRQRDPLSLLLVASCAISILSVQKVALSHFSPPPSCWSSEPQLCLSAGVRWLWGSSSRRSRRTLAVSSLQRWPTSW